ncbi:hypothetical protein [Nostoc sp. MG11]|uniref:hypothetical protein n=1 Tax=Nostoc sp. MG11 TaxID=2721166 RepID=UPI001867FC34|nr:hypothetical protein [Nostoc sp. MG11]
MENKKLKNPGDRSKQSGLHPLPCFIMTKRRIQYTLKLQQLSLFADNTIPYTRNSRAETLVMNTNALK